jgi:hypothetical protein
MKLARSEKVQEPPSSRIGATPGHHPEVCPTEIICGQTWPVRRSSPTARCGHTTPSGTPPTGPPTTTATGPTTATSPSWRDSRGSGPPDARPPRPPSAVPCRRPPPAPDSACSNGTPCAGRSRPPWSTTTARITVDLELRRSKERSTWAKSRFGETDSGDSETQTLGKFEIQRERDSEICYLDGGGEDASAAGVRGGWRPGWRRGTGVQGGGGRLERP